MGQVGTPQRAAAMLGGIAALALMLAAHASAQQPLRIDEDTGLPIRGKVEESTSVDSLQVTTFSTRSTELTATAAPMTMAVAAATAAAAPPPLLGIERSSRRLYSVSHVDAAVTYLATLDADLASLEHAPDGFLYGFTSGQSAVLHRVDPESFQSVPIGLLHAGFVFEGGLAIAADGTGYGTNVGSTGSPRLFEVDLATALTFEVGVISDGPHDINGLVWREDGMLVGIDRTTNSLIEIDPRTAQSNLIALLPAELGGVGGMAVLDGVAYFSTAGPLASAPGSSELYTVDLFTGEASRVDALPMMMTGFGFSGLAAISQASDDENTPPVADPGEDVTIGCTGGSAATYTLDGSGSTDADSTPGTNDDIESFDWFENFGLPSESFLGSGETLDWSFSLGAHDITLRVTDFAGAADVNHVTITVGDSAPPALSILVDPETLWPPTGELVDVAATVTASDACSEPTVELTSITSSEAAVERRSSRRGEPDIAGAELGAPDFAFQLRAERGAGSDRIYTITYTATDESGNATVGLATVVVPQRAEPPGQSGDVPLGRGRGLGRSRGR